MFVVILIVIKTLTSYIRSKVPQDQSEKLVPKYGNAQTLTPFYDALIIEYLLMNFSAWMQTHHRRP